MEMHTKDFPVIVLVFLLLSAAAPAQTNPCDLSKNGTVDAADVNLAVNMSIGTVPCTANIQGPAICDIVTVQRVVNAIVSGTCVTGKSTGNQPLISHSVTLSWTASSSAGVTGYNVYRATTSGGPYTKANASLISATTFVDSAVQAGQTYFYVATAVNSTGLQSPYSTQIQATIPSP